MLRIIDNSKTSAVVRSAELYMDSVEQAIMRENLKSKFSPSTCTIQSDGNLLCDDTELEIEMSGEKPTGGTITLEDGKITNVQDMTLGGYVLETDEKGNIVIKGTSSKGDEEKVELGYLKSASGGLDTDTFWDGSIKKNQVEKIVFKNTKEVPGDAIDSWDVSEQQNESIMAWYLDEDGNGLYELYIGQNGGVKANPDSSYLFYQFNKATTIDLTYLYTSEVTDMSYMFQSCGNLITLDLSSFDTSHVTNMAHMFAHCSSLTNITFGENFNTSEVIDMSEMFTICSNLISLDLSTFNTNQVKNMLAMFATCSNLTTIDMRNAVFTSVTNSYVMFNSDSSIETIYVKDEAAQTFINSRLQADSISNVNVIIAS